MTRKLLALSGLAVVAALGSLYAILAMFTQAMLGGYSPQEVWWDRVYAWWVDFLAAGLLAMLAVYFWRKSRRSDAPLTAERRSRMARRLVLFPLAHVFLTTCLYFADFGSHLRRGLAPAEGSARGTVYLGIAVACGAAAFATFRSAHKLKDR